MHIQKEYLPAKCLLWRTPGAENAECFIGNSGCQIARNTLPPLLFAPGDAFLLDFGRELAGGAAIVSYREGRVRLRFGESASEAMGEPDQTHAIHDAELPLPFCGTLEFGATGFRFLRIDVLDELELGNVLAAETLIPVEETGGFTSSDPLLDDIWRTARQTVRLCMGNYIYDGAKRDRLVWMGDLYPEIRTILHAYGAHPHISRSLDFVRDDTPCPKFMNGITSYSLWWIVCQHAYYRYGGDLAYLKKQHACLDELLHRFGGHIDREGREALPGRRFLDWPNDRNPEAVHAGLQGLAAWAFRCGETLALALGDRLLAQFAGEACRRLSGHVPATAVKSARALQILAGITADDAPLLADPLRNISTFGGGFVLEALAQTGRHAEALRLIREYWGAMLSRGATTFWEDFNLDWLENSGRIDELTPKGKRDLHADFGDFCYKGLRHSLCHGWASSPLSWMSETLLGIRFIEPGGERCRFNPALPEAFEYLAGTVPTPHGPISVELERGKPPRVAAPARVELISNRPGCGVASGAAGVSRG